MKRTIFLAIVAGMVILAHAQNWSFGGGTIYFDNAPTQWNETKMMLVIGNECWSEIYEMQPSEQANRWSVALPSHWNRPSYKLPSLRGRAGVMLPKCSKKDRSSSNITTNSSPSKDNPCNNHK